MIKLVASDLDGTLLNSNKEISKHIPCLIRKLKERGILFAAISGRSRDGILSYFGNAPIIVVANNGGMAYSPEGKLLCVENFSYETAENAMEVIEKTPYMHPVLSGLKNTYLPAGEDKEAIKFAGSFFQKMEFYSELKEVFDTDHIVKISINTGRDGRNEVKGLECMKPFENDFSLVLSGDGWVDLMKKDVSKGTTLEKVCTYYNIPIEETIVFGDYLNDLDMLRRTPNSYAMANAHPEVKKMCAKTIRYTNDENGVIRELADIFDIWEVFEEERA